MENLKTRVLRSSGLLCSFSPLSLRSFFWVEVKVGDVLSMGGSSSLKQREREREGGGGGSK